MPLSLLRGKDTHKLAEIECVIILGHHYSIYVITSNTIVRAPRISLQIPYLCRFKQTLYPMHPSLPYPLRSPHATSQTYGFYIYEYKF